MSGEAMAGERLRDRYEVLEVLGEGGEARVVRAFDRQLGRTAALKIRPSGIARDELLREARVLLSLEPHPSLPLVREDFFAGSDYVIVMDWVDGVDLERLLRQRGTPGLAPTTVLRYLAQAAEALTHLHTHEPPVLHGDVKPANMILTGRGRLVLVDFGLAGSGTDAVSGKGTRGFVAPEIAAGAAPTPASDVYSLAMSALTLLTGESHSGGRPSWPEAIEAQRARVFERALAIGTATDPARRPSAGEFLELLRADWETDLPTGVLTFLVTGIDNSGALWEEDATAMTAALVRHDALIEHAVESRRGRLIRTMVGGDSTVSVFTAATDAVPAAAAIVRALEAEPWPDPLTIRVRAGLHTGEAERRGSDYAGTTLHRTLAIRDEADRGQILLSDATARLVDAALPDGFGLIDLGTATLSGLGAPERLHALRAPGIAATPSPAACPYRGLQAFEIDDDELFFGREKVIERVVGHLASERFFAVVGASGSGKSSLVRAGVLAAARRGAIGGIASGEAVTPAQGLPIDRASHLLVVDQLEEIFTQEEGKREAFIDALLSLERPVLVALRADFYGHCAPYQDLAQRLSQRQFLLGPMTADEMRRAIEEPARTAGLRLEPGLTDMILRDAADEPGALPLLSHALMETWARRDGRTLTLAGYHEAGGVRGAIARTAEEVYESAAAEEQTLIRRMMLRMTDLAGPGDTRRRVRTVDLVSDEKARAVLEQLVRARLVTTDADSTQLAHEALIREWPRLQNWLHEDRESLRLRHNLTGAATAWDAAGRESADLYRGVRLTTALDSIDRADLSELERTYLDASVVEHDRELRAAREQARRLRRRLAAAAVALAVAIVAASVAVVQRSNAVRSSVLANAGRLAALSRDAAPEHPDLGLLLALEANKLDDSVDTRGALAGALQQGARIIGVIGGFDAGAPETIAFAPDGVTFAIVSPDGIRFYDAATRRPRGPMRKSSGSGWLGADFSPDGRTLAVTNEQGDVELWDVAAQRMVRALRSPDRVWLNTVAYSPDGATIAAGAREVPHITLWDTRTGRVLGESIRTRSPGSGGAHAFAFGSDSRLLVAPGERGEFALYDVRTGRMIGAPFTTGSATVEAVKFTPDGAGVVAAHDDGTISVWDIEEREIIGEPLSTGEDPIGVVDISTDGRLLAVGTFSGLVHVWDTASGQRVGPPLVADTTPVNDVTFAPSGEVLGMTNASAAIVFDVGGRQAIGEPFGRDLVTDVAFRPDGGELAAARYDGSIGLFDPASRIETARIAVGAPVLSVRYSPDGTLIAAGSTDGKARMWASGSRERLATLDAGTAWVWQVAFSPDGTRLAIAVDPNGPRNPFAPDRQGEVQLWDVASQRRIGHAMVPRKHAVTAVAFSPDGSLIASGSFEERTQLWDADTQRRFGRPMDVADDGVASMTFSADGSRLVTGGAAVVRMWDVARQRLAAPPLKGHTGGVVGASVDAEGRYLATTSQQGATKLWDARTGTPVGGELIGWKPASSMPDVDFDTPFLPVRSAFSPDGRRLAVAGIESRAMIWEMSLATWRARACQIASRNLTRAEWTQYLPGEPYGRTCAQWPAGPAA